MFYLLYIRCNTRTQTNTRRPLQAREMGTPPARSKQLPHTMSNHKPNDIRARNDRHTITNEPGNLHTRSNHPPPQHDTQGAHPDRNTITPPGVGILLLSRG